MIHVFIFCLCYILLVKDVVAISTHDPATNVPKTSTLPALTTKYLVTKTETSPTPTPMTQQETVSSTTKELPIDPTNLVTGI